VRCETRLDSTQLDVIEQEQSRAEPLIRSEDAQLSDEVEQQDELH
jgi:hypothetical protein